MTTEPEWGPRIEHDGKGCPCNGEFVHAVFDKGFPVETFSLLNTPGDRLAWYWDKPRYPIPGKIIRYRIRKPRAMKLLQSIVENPPKQRIKEDA